MNPEHINALLGHLERAGAGVLALGGLLATQAEKASPEEISGAGYLLDIVGERIVEQANEARTALYAKTT